MHSRACQPCMSSHPQMAAAVSSTVTWSPHASSRHPPQVAAASGKHVNSLRDTASKQGIILPLEERVEVLNLFKAASDLHASAPSISIISTNKAARLLRKMKCLCAAGYFASLNKFEPPTAFHQPGTPEDDYLAPEAAVAVEPTPVCTHHRCQSAYPDTAVPCHLYREYCGVWWCA